MKHSGLAWITVVSMLGACTQLVTPDGGMATDAATDVDAGGGTDAGAPPDDDAGADAGTDAGPGDAGPGDAGPQPTITCDSASCDPASQECCYGLANAASMCITEGDACSINMTAGVYRMRMECDSHDDCSTAGHVCCNVEVYISNSTACMHPTDCVTEPASPYTTYRRVVCDPAMASTGCPSGQTCQISTDQDPRYPPTLYTCLES